MPGFSPVQKLGEQAGPGYIMGLRLGYMGLRSGYLSSAGGRVHLQTEFSRHAQEGIVVVFSLGDSAQLIVSGFLKVRRAVQKHL